MKYIGGFVVSMQVTPNLLARMNPADQRTYGPGIHPPDDPHPEAKTDRLERKEQASFANFCLFHSYPFVWHATHKPSKATPGAPDFWVGVNRASLWIEFKRDYSCKLSSDQEEFGRKLEAQGMLLYVVYSSFEAIKLVESFDALV